MSDTLRNLRAGRDVSWGSLVPAFDWAIHEAIEAEYRASVASDAALSHIAPTYPTIVALLAEAGRATNAARADQ